MRKRSAKPDGYCNFAEADAITDGAHSFAHEDQKKLASLIDSATNSPLLQLDYKLLSAIKGLVRRSDANVSAAFELLNSKLVKPHSQVRLLTLLLMDELFTRSKHFRSLLVPVFENFLILSVGFRSDYPLPPPRDRATVLRKKSIEIVQKWSDMFGQHYKPLRLAYDYLKHILRYEFPSGTEDRTLAQQQRNSRESRTQELLKKKFVSLKAEFSNHLEEVQSTLNEITECLTVLTEKSVDDESTDSCVLDSEQDGLEEYGAWSLRSTRDEVEEQVILPRETVDNAALFDSLRDLYRVLTTRHLVNVQEWLSTLMRVDPEDDRGARDTLLRGVIDVRNRLLKARDKCEVVGIETRTSTKSVVEDMDEIVWEEGDVLVSNSAVSEAVADTIFSAKLKDSIESVVREFIDTGQASEEMCVSTIKPEVPADTSLRGQLLQQAPVLKWGAFLERWGSDSAIPVNNRGMEFENHWGKVDYDVTVPVEKLAESNLNLRAVYYSAEKKEIQPCLAPLRNGSLCQRRDLKRCPFHGPIVPRHTDGSPVVERHDPDNFKDVRKEERESGDTNTRDSEFPAPPPVNVNDVSLDLARRAVVNVRQKDEELRKIAVQDKANARRKRAKMAREHNESCLRVAAMASSSQGLGELLKENVVQEESTRRKPRGGMAALLRKKPTVKDRLARRLLNGRVRDATTCQLVRDEEAAYRESFPNQW